MRRLLLLLVAAAAFYGAKAGMQTLRLADHYFALGEYARALEQYEQIRDNAYSGDVREGMLYRKAFCLVKAGYYDEADALLAKIKGNSAIADDARFLRAYIAYVGGRYDEAYRLFEALQQRGVRLGETDFYLNQMDYLRGDYAKVARQTERLLEKGAVAPELLGETLRAGGLANFKTGDKTKARKMLEKYTALAGDGAELTALYALGTIYYDEGNDTGALPLFTAVTEDAGPLAQSSWLYIGQIHSGRGDTRAAALAFDKAARESWDHGVAETAAFNLAVASTDGLALPFSDAATAIERFVAAYPDSPYASELSNYLANAYYGRHDYAAALRQTERIANPTAETLAMKQRIQYQYGVQLFRQGKISEAITMLRGAASGRDRDVAAQASLWLGEALYARKDYTAAARAYEQALAGNLLGDNTRLAQYDLGYAYMKLKDYRKAEVAFRRAGDFNDARLRLADCLYYTGKYTEALALYRDLKLDGGQDGVYASIREADILGRNGDVSGKIAILERLADRQDAGVWRKTVLQRLADAYSERGDDRKASELYTAMLETADGNADDTMQAYYSLATNADNLYAAGDREGALQAYRRLEGAGVPALYAVAVLGIMRTTPDADEADRYIAKAAALPGLTPEEAAEVDFRAADALLKKGDYDAAEEALLKIIDAGSDSNYWLARAYIDLSDVYAATGKDYLARLYLENLRANYPGGEREIQQMINSRLK